MAHECMSYLIDAAWVDKVYYRYNLVGPANRDKSEHDGIAAYEFLE